MVSACFNQEEWLRALTYPITAELALAIVTRPNGVLIAIAQKITIEVAIQLRITREVTRIAGPNLIAVQVAKEISIPVVWPWLACCVVAEP